MAKNTGKRKDKIISLEHVKKNTKYSILLNRFIVEPK